MDGSKKHAKDLRMSSKNTAICVNSLSKCFEIYNSPRDRLKQFIIPKVNSLVDLPSKQYFQEFWALNDVSFEIKKGDSVGIIGVNGSGKSTLLQIICGTLSPTKGSVEIHGRIAALLELGSGFNPEFTGRENVYMNGLVLGLSKEEVDDRFTKIIEFADIGEFIEQPIKTFSSGMILRLAFAVIAHVDADILIIDEALSVGDIFFTQKCMRFLQNFMLSGTVLFVSHDTGAIVNLCNKAILINRGHITKTGSAKDVTESYIATLCENNYDQDSAPKNNSDIKSIKALKAKTEPTSQEEFGTGIAKIISSRLIKPGAGPLKLLKGNEDVILEVRCLAKKSMSNPIVGFQFKDRLGQVIFGENTSINYQQNLRQIPEGTELIAKFEFHLPMLPAGDYSVTVAIAEDTNGNHIQHHWIHDALAFKVNSSNVSFGLIGVPMKKIDLSAL